MQILTSKVPFPCLLVDWAKEYGPIYSYSVLGETTIVINSAADAHELFDLRSTIYNSRPASPPCIDLRPLMRLQSLPLLRDFLCKRANIAFEVRLLGAAYSSSGEQPYGDSWRRHRRAVHHELNVRQVGQYSHIQEREVGIALPVDIS